MQNAIGADIAKHMGEEFDTRRFIPYVSMHEFEALLFADCGRFASVVGRHPDRLSTGQLSVLHGTNATLPSGSTSSNAPRTARCNGRAARRLRPLNHQTANQFCSDRSLLSSKVLIVSEETLKWLAASWQRSSERSFPRKSQTAS